jgi:TRAP-type mannitol/chloroaromatic compound transport system permease small subunit
MNTVADKNETRLSGLVSRLVTLWALLGGTVLLAVVVMQTWSVIGNQFGMPFPGDFEMTEIGVAIAAFAFLPYCQFTGSNVTADIFTSGASRRTVAIFTLMGSLVAFGFSTLLLWRMSAGMLDQKSYEYETAVLQFPNWIGWIPVLVSLALLAVASLATILRDVRTL